MARRDAATCGPREPVDVVRRRAREGGWTSSVVVDERRVVLGVVAADARLADRGTTVEEVMDPAPITVRADVGIEELPDYAPSSRPGPRIVTTPDGVLIGTVAPE